MAASNRPALVAFHVPCECFCMGRHHTPFLTRQILSLIKKMFFETGKQLVYPP